MREPSMQNSDVAQGKGGEYPQTFTAGHGVECVHTDPSSHKNRFELAVREESDALCFVGDPTKVIRYSISDLRIGDTIYLKKKDTNNDFRVKLIDKSTKLRGKVINTHELYTELSIGDIFIFSPEHIMSVTDSESSII